MDKNLMAMSRRAYGYWRWGVPNWFIGRSRVGTRVGTGSLNT